MIKSQSLISVLFAIFSMILIANPAQSQENCWLKYPYSDDFNDVHFSSETEGLGWAVANNGIIIHTRDSGKTWEPQKNNFLKSLHSVHFTSDSIGWAVGQDGKILHTKDQGKNWDSQHSVTNNNLNSVYFVSDSTGVAAGDSGTILRTTDMGATWRKIAVNTNKKFRAIDFGSDSTGYVAGFDDAFYRTTDTGKTWDDKSFSNYDNVYAVSATSDTTVWVSYGTGAGTDIMHSTDGGATWSLNKDLVFKVVSTLHFSSPSTGWGIGGIDGYIIHTNNKGSSWTVQNKGNNGELGAIHFASDKVGAVLGQGVIRNTLNGGSTWKLQQKGMERVHGLEDIYMVSDTIGWVVGYGRTIMHQDNAQGNWTFQNRSFPNTRRYRAYGAVYFSSNKTGWVADYGGDFRYTTDEGSTWTKKTNPNPGGGRDLYFINNNVGILVGGSRGDISRTTDGGSNWNHQSPNSNALYSVHFSNDSMGWISGFNGDLLYSVDSGASWSFQNSGTSESLNSIYFISDSVGWVVGSNGTILNTKNAGNQWVSVASPTNEDLNSVHFPSDSVGWIVGDNGTVVHTTDQGSNWKVMPANIRHDLNSVFFTSDSSGWAAGNFGALHSFSNKAYIKGEKSFCMRGNSKFKTYQVRPIGNDYQWNVSGGKIISGAGTNQIRVEWDTTGVSKIHLTRKLGKCTQTGSIEVERFAIPYPQISGPKTVCVNDTNKQYSVKNKPGRSYHWEASGGTIIGPQDTSSVFVKWDDIDTGNLKVIQTIDSTGCKGEDILDVNVQPNPEPTITGQFQTCEFTNTYQYKTSQTNNYKNNWAATGGKITSDSFGNQVNVKWKGAGHGSLKLTQKNKVTGCDSTVDTSITIQENPKPAISGPSSACQAKGGYQYQTPDVPGHTYKWSAIGGIFSKDSTGNRVQVKWKKSNKGVIKVTQTNKNTGCDTTVVYEVKLYSEKPNPIISGPSEVCANSSYNRFTVPNQPLNSFQWSIFGGHLLSGQKTDTILVKWNQADSATIKLTQTIDSTGCDTTVKKNVDVLPIKKNKIIDTACETYRKPESNDFYTTSGIYFDTVTSTNQCDSVIKLNLTVIDLDTTISKNNSQLIANEQSVDEYQWLDCDAHFKPIKDANKQTFIPEKSGSYAVALKFGDCVDTSECVTWNNVGMSGRAQNQHFSIYPNPFKEQFNLKFSQPLKDASLNIYNVNGKIVKQQKSLNGQNFLFSLSKYSPGFYRVEIKTRKRIFHEKIIKNQ